MIKIIDGRKYDISTSEKIACLSNSNISDFYCYDELYITKEGYYFLYGSEVIPITREEAYQWCKETKNTATILEYFSDLIEEA